MVDAPLSSLPKRRKRSDDASGKEKIGRFHPFFKWTKGDTLRGLVVVATHISHGVTFIELSTARVDSGMPPAYVKDALDRRPEMKISGQKSLLKGMISTKSSPRSPPANKTVASGWTVVTLDGSLAPLFEHTVLITADGVEILTLLPESKW